MNLTCLIIDDELFAAEILAGYINKLPGLRLIGIETDALKATEKLQSGTLVADIVFLDVEMPGKRGIEIARLLEYLSLVVFVTGHPIGALDAIELGAADYLRKPVSFPRFTACINKIKDQVALKNSQRQTSANATLLVKGERKGYYEFVSIGQIVIVESIGNYSKFTLDNASHIITHESISSIERKLPPDLFMRVHKQIIVNLTKRKSISGFLLEMVGGMKITIGRKYHAEFLQRTI